MIHDRISPATSETVYVPWKPQSTQRFPVPTIQGTLDNPGALGQSMVDSLNWNTH